MNLKEILFYLIVSCIITVQKDMHHVFSVNSSTFEMSPDWVIRPFPENGVHCLSPLDISICFYQDPGISRPHPKRGPIDRRIGVVSCLHIRSPLWRFQSHVPGVLEGGSNPRVPGTDEDLEKEDRHCQFSCCEKVLKPFLRLLSVEWGLVRNSIPTLALFDFN